MSLNLNLNLSFENTVRFLDLYARETLLYDTTHQDYRNRRMRGLATQRVAAQLGVPGFGPQEVTFKFKNLRNSYSQELKKMEESSYSYYPKVHWFPLMNSFLRPFIYTRPVVSNLVKPVKSEGNRGQPETDDECRYVKDNDPDRSSESVTTWVQLPSPEEENDASDVNEHLQVDLDEYLPTSTVINGKRMRAVTHDQHSRQEKYLRKSESSEVVTPAMDQQDTSDSGVSARKEDVHDHFGRYISSLLRELGPPECFLLQQEVTGLVLERIRDTYIKREPSD